MALKFLNKKGWHTGSLRNIENVWKAEQKHEAEQKKLEELRKQIQEERERDEFRALQEQAGYVSKQERLEFMYDSGLSVGKGSASSGTGVAFKALEESIPSNKTSTSSGNNQPGALFEDKPSSANDAWRKLHSDPLLLIRQREQETLARIKNNPVQMAAIRKSVEGKKDKDKSIDKKERRKKESVSNSKHPKHSSSKQQSDSKKVSDERGKMGKDSTRKSLKNDEHYYKSKTRSDDESSDTEKQRRKTGHGRPRFREESPSSFPYSKDASDVGNTTRKDHYRSKREKHSPDGRSNTNIDNKEWERFRPSQEARYGPYASAARNDSHYKRRTAAPKLSEGEQAAKLREMQADAELHEDQRWKRLRKAEEDDAREVTNASSFKGNNFLDAAQKSVFGAEKGGSSTIEESVRRRTYYSQGRSEVSDGNAFRR